MTYAEWAGWKDGEKAGTNGGKSGIIEPTEQYRKNDDVRSSFKFISDKRFEQLTIKAKKQGAVIIRGGESVERHLNMNNAAASVFGDVIMFRKDVCISEVLEETYHFEQNKKGLNDDKQVKLRMILNEIDAKEYLLANAEKFGIPRNEMELTEKQLGSYRKELEEYMKEGGAT